MGTLLKIAATCTVIAVLLAGCAGLQPQVVPGENEGAKVVELKADSFRFEPNNIRALEGDAILFRIENISGSTHNFTVSSPGQQTLTSVALPANKKVDVNVAFTEAGVYEFYCDKAFHSSFGMKGRVEVVKKGPGSSR